MALLLAGIILFGGSIVQGFANAELAERLLREAGCWQIVAPAQMAIVTFRCIPTNDDAALVSI